MGNGVGLGHVSALQFTRRCQKQKDKRLWTDYSRLDIMHHLRYDGTYRLSLFMELSQGVDVNYAMPCMFAGTCFTRTFSTPTESAAILSTAREMMFFTKTNLERSYFRFASPPTLERPGHETTPHPRPEGLELSLWLPEG